mgnify:FL=1
MIQFLGYDPEQRTLRVSFSHGPGKATVYDYYLVPPDVAHMAEAEMKGEDGGFFRKSVRGVYPSRKVA